MSCLLRIVVGCLFISVMGGCSTIDNTSPDYRTDNKKSTTAQPLEIPPDLISSTHIEEQMVVPQGDGTTTFSDYNSGRTIARAQQPTSGINVLPVAEKVQIKRDGNTRWLVLQGEPNTLWPQVKQFWLKQGFTLKLENPSIGIMETEWAENRADIPQDGIRKYLGKILDMVYSASTRDKFRVRLERGSVAGTTELYLIHRGAEEVAKGNDWVWQNRPSDPELEAEMLNRLMVFVGIEKEQADTLVATTTEDKPVSRAQLIRSGQIHLVVQEDFARAWRRTGIALDRIGFTVEDRDRSRGMYFIRYVDPEPNKDKGVFARWFGGDSTPSNQEYRLLLTDEASTTRIVVLDNQEQRDTSNTAEKILTLLQEQLK